MKQYFLSMVLIGTLFFSGCLPIKYEYYIYEAQGAFKAKGEELSVFPYFGFGALKEDQRKLKIYGPPYQLYFRIQDGLNRSDRKLLKIEDVKISVSGSEDKVDFIYSEWKDWTLSESENGRVTLYSREQKIDLEWELGKAVDVNVDFIAVFKSGEKIINVPYNEVIVFRAIHKVEDTNVLTRYLSQ